LFRKKNTEKSLGGDTSGESVTTFYRYDKKKKLGEGAFAEVFKAQLVVPRKHGTAEDYAKVVNEDGTFRYNDLQKSSDMRQDVQYALKIIDRSKVEDMNDITREVAIMHVLSHPNIIQLYEVFYEPKTVTLVMELVSGGELFDRIVDKGNYSEKDAAGVIAQLCAALAYLHDKKIVHRDLKPENLLYAAPSPDETLKVADFGLARKVAKKGEMMKTACGTPGYVAPEILANKGYDNTAVDMWSVGVILYILLCGFPPFYEEELPALFDSILKARYDFPSPWWDTISPQAKSLVKACLTIKADQRMTARQMLEEPWVASEAPATSLAGSQKALKKYMANQRLRKAALGIIAKKRLERALEDLRAKVSE
jgi:serine/threonine protein kinase